MDFRLLGPVEVSANGRLVPLGGAKPQALLAALLLDHGRVVPISHLIDVLWPQNPPDTARAVIQTYVKTLRQSLRRHGIHEAILTRSPGYMARIPPNSLDLHVFEQLVTQAHASADLEKKSELLGKALALWRGPAMAGLDHTLLAGEAARLNELRLSTTEERIAVDMALGRHELLLPELTALVERHPTNERLRAHHLVCLHEAGRVAEALASYRRGRDLMVQELGIEPGPELARLHSAILRGDAELLQASSRKGRPRAVPEQLPITPPDFTGRLPQIEALTAAMTSVAPAWAAPIQVISGKGGSGKSALAIRVARQLAPDFPDGQLYAELRGMTETPAEPGEVLGHFLKALGMDPAHVPRGWRERAERFRGLLAGRRVLLVLDDAASASQVEALLPGVASCAVLITSRDRLPGLAGAHRMDLDVLELDEAIELLGRIAGHERVNADKSAAQDIVEYCGRMPLAIRIAGARLATRQRWPLALLADRLADERRRLDELSIGDLEMRASFLLSYRGLDPQARTALRRLGHLGVQEFPLWIVSWLLETTDEEAERIVERLVDAHVVDFCRVDELGCVRYRLHDLLRIYGRERAEAEESPDVLRAAVERVLGGWLNLISTVCAQSPPDEIQWWRTVPTYPVSQATTQLVVSAPHTWFTLEQPALVVGVERAAALGLHDLACHFASARLGPSFLGVNRFESRERINAAALAAARRAGDQYGEAVMLSELGQLRHLQDSFLEASEHFSAALARFRALGDIRGQAVALTGLGTVYREPGRLAEASGFLGQAIKLLRSLGERAGIAHVQRLSGSIWLELGDYEAAWCAMQESLSTYREVGSRRGEALTLRTIGLFHRARGRLEESADSCAQALAIFRQLGDTLMEAYAVRAHAKAHLRMGLLGDALTPLEWSLSVCRAMGDRWGQAITLRTLGELHLAAGRLDEAAACLAEAEERWRSMECHLWLARTHRDRALLHEARGEHHLADAVRQRALRVFRQHGAREYIELTQPIAEFQGVGRPCQKSPWVAYRPGAA
ncbi:AfsR/SARP family transcriptional regulator [Thermoactinospora rubra]|uniref:AfsR/SARP family transcriptional regulator n=1 Tax=Thermoactinospora rubra TaxID=1088767 RepID=UPI00117DC5D3|nr:BTAD domain-containing putative transcriptional regulator [Thermoactinospora rubra]